ncbi:MAG: spermidine synthase [Halorientalis sp.]
MRATAVAGRIRRPELAVFGAGVASMGLEILAGRLIAPQFGSSIYTWGSIIGVFLAALSLGYWVGGRRAARRASGERLAVLLLATASYVALLVVAGDLLLRASAGIPLPARYASLPAVVVLFGPPTYLLGFVSPYAAELSLKDGVGEASGHVYAVGTVGSIVGAFGTTFLLIPAFPVGVIGFLFGLLLVGTALALLFPDPPVEQVAAAVVVLLLLVGAVALPAAGYAVSGEVVYATQTPYQELRVVDSGDVRTLYLGGQRHSAMDLDDPTRHVFEYTRYFHLPLLFTDGDAWDRPARADSHAGSVDRVLFVGGGGFTGPRRFLAEYENVTVDVVEIDPAVVRVAREYFRVPDSPRLNVHTMDGRRYLRTTNRTYDLVVLDAYRKDKVPFHLTTVEFMRLVRERLDEDGLLLVNLISARSGPAAQFYRAEYRTMDAAFEQVYSFPTNDANVVQNIELVATTSSERLTREELLARNERRPVGIDLAGEIRTYDPTVASGDAPLLRDEDAPVDALLEPMAGQRYVVTRATRNAT